MRTMKIFPFLLLLASVNSFAQPKDVIYQTTSSPGYTNTRIGQNSGNATGTGGLNTFIGTDTGKSITSGYYNTFVGHEAGANNTEGGDNVFIGGKFAGVSNTIGSLNVMIGRESGLGSIDGVGNAFVGYLSGSQNISGSGNSYFGPGANGKGDHNVALGSLAGNNSTGSDNISIGTKSGKSAASNFNIVIGTYGQYCPALTFGEKNTFLGFNSAFYFTSGISNLIMGSSAGNSLTTGNNNTFVGTGSGAGAVTGSGNTLLGTAGFGSGVFNDSKTGSDTNNTVILADGAGHNRMILDNNGFAGIGLGYSDRPQAMLDVNGAPRFRGLLATTDNSFFLSVDDLGNVKKQSATNGTGWNLTGNSGTASATNFLGTIDDQDLVFRKNNRVSGLLSASTTIFGTTGDDTVRRTALSSLRNTYIGSGAGQNYRAASLDNTFVGFLAGGGSFSMGNENTFIGAYAGFASQRSAEISTGGIGNTCLGFKAGENNAVGSGNTFLGRRSGAFATGNNNTFVGLVNGATTVSSTIILADGAGSQRLYIDPSGNAGIGLANFALPHNKLEIRSDVANPSLSGLRLTNLTAGTTGITDNTNNKFLTVDGSGDVILQNLSNAALTDTSLYKNDGVIDNTTTTAGVRTVDMNNSNIFFKSQVNALNGRIYIGASQSFPTTAPAVGNDYRLFVEGGILTEKIKVALRNDGNWADYVFADGYQLMKLSDIETFINENKHLPGIEPADELVKNGLDLGDMQAKQMAKIEELTLYAIGQDKKLEAQKAALENQNNEIETLKAQVKLLMEKK